VVQPSWPSCVSALGALFYANRKAGANASFENDLFVLTEQDEYRCCGWLHGNDAAVPPFYTNQTCVGLYKYTRSCQQAVTDTLVSSIGAVGGIGIAIAVIQVRVCSSERRALCR
jgi:hypothetical protein